VCVSFATPLRNMMIKAIPLLILLFLLKCGKTRIIHTSERLRAALESDCELNTLHKEYRLAHQHTRPHTEQQTRLVQFREEIRMVLALRENPEVEWDADITFMADMTVEEHDLYKTGFNETWFENHDTLQSSGSLSAGKAAPLYFDGWRVKGLLRPISKQKKKSCWAHTAACALEAQLAEAKGIFEKLSVQELYDCSLEEGQHAIGGHSVKAWRYVKRSGRLGLASDTEELDGPNVVGNDCKYYESTYNALEGTILMSIIHVAPGNDEELKYAVSAISPVTVNVDTLTCNMKAYKGRKKFTALECGKSPDHGMVVVGYTIEYWIVRNSWGADWGEKGHVWWDREGLDCFLKQEAYYPYLMVESSVDKREKREAVENINEV